MNTNNMREAIYIHYTYKHLDLHYNHVLHKGYKDNLDIYHMPLLTRFETSNLCWVSVSVESTFSILDKNRVSLVGVNHQPPVHQFRMKSFNCFGDEPKTHPLPMPIDFSAFFSTPKFSPPTYFPPPLPTYLPSPTSLTSFPIHSILRA